MASKDTSRKLKQVTNKFCFRNKMQQFRFDRSEQPYPKLDHFQEFNNKLDAKENQHSILDLYSKTRLLRNVPKSNFMSPVHPRLSAKNVRKDLGHDLYQLTKDNHHEVNLSPHPSLTIMVQPNKIDYSKRSMNVIIVKKSFCSYSKYI